MNKAKTDDKVKITVVHQHDVSNHHDTEYLGDHDTLEQKITVVDEPFSTYLQAKWLTLMRSPLLFVASLILAMAMGYLSAYWRYQRGVQISKELTASKNEEIAEYGQQPLIRQATTKYYARLANDELREESLDFISQMRKFILKWGVVENQTALSLMDEMPAKTSEEEKQRIWQHYLSTSNLVLETRILDYEKEFRTKAIFLRNELLSRLPDLRRNNSADSFYQKTDNPVDIRKVMDDLTLLTESLLSP